MGALLKSARKAAGLRQLDVAMAIGVAPKTYEQWEQGYVAIKARHIPLIAEALGASIEHLTSILAGEAPPADTPEIRSTAPDVDTLSRALAMFMHLSRMKLSDLVKTSGVKSRTIEDILLGNIKHPSRETIRRLSHGLATDPNDLSSVSRIAEVWAQGTLLRAAGYSEAPRTSYFREKAEARRQDSLDIEHHPERFEHLDEPTVSMAKLSNRLSEIGERIHELMQSSVIAGLGDIPTIRREEQTGTLREIGQKWKEFDDVVDRFLELTRELHDARQGFYRGGDQDSAPGT